MVRKSTKDAFVRPGGSSKSTPQSKPRRLSHPRNKVQPSSGGIKQYSRWGKAGGRKGYLGKKGGHYCALCQGQGGVRGLPEAGTGWLQGMGGASTAWRGTGSGVHDDV